MALNENPCKLCVHFDQIILGDGSKRAAHGWCAVRSEYPAKEQPGQTFPIDAKRVADGQLAKPYIVKKDQIVQHCILFKLKPPPPAGPRKPVPPPIPWKRIP